MKKAQELKKFKDKMQRHKTLAEEEFSSFFSKIYTKEELKNQCIFGFYILDFVIAPRLLVIEIDGESHNDRRGYDFFRDAFIRKCGLEILRITNEEIFNHFELIIAKIDSYPIKENWDKKFRSSLGKANSLKGYTLKKKKLEVLQPRLL